MEITIVTTLPALAGSFSGHARANAPRSALKAPSGPANECSPLATSGVLRAERFLCPTANTRLLKSRIRPR